MKTRKILLLAAIAVLGGAYALELALAGSESIKTLVLAEKPDSVLLDKGDGTSLLLSKDGDAWVVGDKKYPADAGVAAEIVKAVESVKILDSVSRDGDGERYGLSEKGGLAVTAKKGGKELRRLSVGKASATSQQSYVRLDGGKDVLLVSGNLKRTFDKKLDELRNKEIFSFKPGDLKAVAVSGKANYQLAKSGTPEAWKVAAPAADASLKPDQTKLDTWLSSVSTLRAEGFAPEAPLPAGKPVGELSLDLGSRRASLVVHAKAGEDKYLCSSSESPYPFYLSTYVVDRDFKPLYELMMK
jgi:hypothetical protein